MKEKDNKIKRIISIFLVLAILMPVFGTTVVESAKMEEASFDYFIDILQKGAFEEAGGAFEQPVGQFTIESSDGQKISSLDFPSMGTPYDVMSTWEAKGRPMGLYAFPTTEAIMNAPSVMTVPVGTTLKLKDISQGSMKKNGSKASIVYRDWQHFYLSPNHDDWLGGKSTQGAKDNTTWKADKEGYMYLFLSVGDNNSPYGSSWVNHQSSGNYRTAGVNYINFIKGSKTWSNEHGNSKDWFYTMVKIKVGGESEMILREMELVDPVTNKVLESFKRNIDPSDPFKKQSIVATHSSIKDSTVLQRNKEYKVRAKYQYVDFSEGSFNISGAMTEKQKALTTGVNPNKLDVKYAYDEKTVGQGVWDVSAISTGTPNIALKNLETASFEWSYTVPTGKKAVKIAGFVPSDFAKKNNSTKDDYGVLYAMVEPVDMALNDPLILKVDGKPTSVVVPGKTHTVTVNAEYLLGTTPLGLNHNGQPTGNNRFTISVNAREGSGNGLTIFQLINYA